jgi:hypothetical protein
MQGKGEMNNLDDANKKGKQRERVTKKIKVKKRRNR